MANNRRKKTKPAEDNIAPSLSVVESDEATEGTTENGLSPKKNTVAAVRLEVAALSESLAEIDAKLDNLQSTVTRLDAATRVLAVEEDGEISPVSMSMLHKDVDVLKTITKMLVDRMKKNNVKVQQITDEADRLKAKYSRWL